MAGDLVQKLASLAGMTRPQLVTFFMIRFMRLARTERFVSMTEATRSRNDSVHSVARST